MAAVNLVETMIGKWETSIQITAASHAWTIRDINVEVTRYQNRSAADVQFRAASRCRSAIQRWLQHLALDERFQGQG
jgi:hypothetical protein